MIVGRRKDQSSAEGGDSDIVVEDHSFRNHRHPRIQSEANGGGVEATGASPI